LRTNLERKTRQKCGTIISCCESRSRRPFNHIKGDLAIRAGLHKSRPASRRVFIAFLPIACTSLLRGACSAANRGWTPRMLWEVFRHADDRRAPAATDGREIVLTANTEHERSASYMTKMTRDRPDQPPLKITLLPRRPPVVGRTWGVSRNDLRSLGAPKCSMATLC